MKIYKTQEQVNKDIKNGVLQIQGDVNFECDIVVDCKIYAYNIRAKDIIARNINARNIDARNINAQNIYACNITAWNIVAWDIDAWDIWADTSMDADNISYHSVCCARKSFTCKSVSGIQKYARHFCLDGEIVYKRKER